MTAHRPMNFHRLALWLGLALGLVGAAPSPNVGAQEDELLPPREAFQLTTEVVGPERLRLTFDIAEGYYLYRDKLGARSTREGHTLDSAELPPGTIKHDPFFGEMEIYRDEVNFTVPIVERPSDATAMDIEVRSQGCADIGVCYPPQRHQATLELAALPAAGASPTASDAAGGAPASPSAGDNGVQALQALSRSITGDEPELLPPEQAFRPSAEVIDGAVSVSWQIEPGYYLYRDKLAIQHAAGEGLTIADIERPPGRTKTDEFFGEVQIYRDSLRVPVRVQRTTADPADTLTLALEYQGCADQGVCYPPQRTELPVQLAAAELPPASGTSDADDSSTTDPEPAPPTPTEEAAEAPASAASATADDDSPETTSTEASGATAATQRVSEQDRIVGYLQEGNIAWIVLAFFIFGLLLAFTPCVFPMIPILSSIIIGQGESLTTRRAFVLSLIYVLAMALTYTALGVLAGLFGGGLQAYFQHPAIIGAIVVLFIGLSLSMFGFYELQLPSGLQSRLNTLSNQQQGGSLTGVAVMGLLSALIVSPCVAAPLAGALIFIGQTGDAVLGGTALFALSLGMGGPLLLIGTSAGKLLPKAGGWMDAVKAVFGVLLLAVAVWILDRVVPTWMTALLVGLLATLSGIYMRALEPVPAGGSPWRFLWKGLGIILVLYGLLVLLSLAGGRPSVLEPASPWLTAASTRAPAGVTGEERVPDHLAFEPIADNDGLNRILDEAGAAGQITMLDFYADWCVTCKEMEHATFSDPGVIQALEPVRVVQVDVTANDAADRALLKRFDLFGPPAILFFEPDGDELSGYRVIGFQGPDDFQSLVNEIKNRHG